jgi:phosphate transport system substrate-binding protein
LSLVAVSCGGAGPETDPTQASNNGAGSGAGFANLRGDITIDGSSTVFPIAEAVAEEFGKLTRSKVRVTVGVSGTGGGFKKFCNGETDITNASRPIKASEVALCAAAGVDFVELPVAIDGLTVTVNPENDFVQCITPGDLNIIWAPEAEGKVTRWNQVRPEWPDEPLRLYGPGVDSGTFDYFTQTVNGQAQASRGDFTASEDDNLLVQGISGDRGGLGYFGYAYFAENQDKLKVVAIDGGDGCVAPTPATINDGTYTPLSRPLFIYVRTDAADNPHVVEFIRYHLGAEGRQLAAEVGYVPFPAQVYGLALDRFEKRLTGTIFGGSSPQKGPVEAVLAANQ